MKTSDEICILNLVFGYAEAIDQGNFEAAAAILSDADIYLRNGQTIGSTQLLEIWRKLVIIYEDGTPRTKHVVTNPILEIVDQQAECRSYYSVFQQTEDFPLQMIASGRYKHQFEKRDGKWRITKLDYSLVDFEGDLSCHLRNR
ncbi:MAG: nuclear transport factor 2 family protein [Pseudomonadota bacterium]